MTPDKIRILTLLSDPLLNSNGVPVERLALASEIERLKSELASLNRAVELRLSVASAKNTQNALRDHGPFHILHFTGHGNQDALAFEDDRGGLLPLDPMRWQAIFAPLSQAPAQVAFLSACHSQSMAQALLDAGVPHVAAVDANAAALDVAARAFSAQFYPWLLAGKTVRQAFDAGRAAVLTDAATLQACRQLAEQTKDPALLALIADLDSRGIRPADAVNRLEAMKFKLLPEATNDETDPHAAAPFAHAPPGQLTVIDLPPYPETLGKPLPTFTGRAKEMRNLIDLTAEQKIVTIIGAGGMGKSELSRQTGRWRARRGHFRGGITFIHLGERSRAADARLLIAAALRLAPETSETDRALARALPPDSLLILDELDALCAEDLRPTRALFEALRNHAPGGVRILATSRQPVGVGQKFTLRRLSPQSARDLFLKLARQQTGDELQGTEQELQEILTFLDRYPRAIIQAARQLFSPDLSDLLDDLRHSKEELLQDPNLPAGELRDAESVLITLNSSYRRLQARNPEAAAFFPLLSLFPAGISLAGITSIFGRPARKYLQIIVDLSLVEQTPPLDYYYLPAPVRSYAGRKLQPRPPAPPARKQYGPAALQHYASRTDELNSLFTGGQIEAGTALTALELPNLYAWLDWAYENEADQGDGVCRAARITAGLNNFYTMSPHLRAETFARCQKALAAARRLGDKFSQANTLQSLGDLAMRVADLKAAAQHFQQALDLFQQIDEKLGQANTLQSLG
ncbi:MAG TPA: CHAT domain-containing protein, partial [Chloroflexi bacterium]|nr:CHAT domain-containing protein [Chloroflexota bacterium]